MRSELDTVAAEGVAMGSGRAAPMSRDDRRAAIIEATVPLLRSHGQSVTTKQIAEASGIGEGTIFRVFTDKAELIDACLSAVFDQTPTLEQFAAIDRSLPLAGRVEAGVQILQQRLQSVIELLIAVGFPEAPDGGRRMDPRARAGHSIVLDAFAELLTPDADRLRVSPHRTAQLARMLTFAATHPKINDDEPMTALEITDILLHGVIR